MRTSVADETPESRIVKSILHFPYSEFGDALRQLIEFGGEGFENPDTRAIMGAVRAARSNGGNIAAYLEGDYSLTLELYRTSKEAEPPADVEGDAKKILNRAAKYKIAAALSDIDQGFGGFEVLQKLRKIDCEISNVLPAIADAAAFMAEPITKPCELVYGILHQGSKMVFGGGSKTFKTWTLLDLAVSVATGEPWLSFKVSKGRTLFLNFEIQPGFFQERIQAVTRGKGISLDAGALDVWNLRGHCAGYEIIIPRVIEHVKKSGYALIVCDPVYKLYGATDENSAGAVALLLNSLERLTVDTGAAVAFGAHYSKGDQSKKESIDRISGSGVFARDPDSILNFTRHEEQDAFTVEATLRNFKPVKPFVARWLYPLMRRDDALDPAKLKQTKGKPKKHTVSKLLDLLKGRELSSVNWQKLAQSEKGIPKSSFYELLDEARSNPNVKQTQAGQWFYKECTNEQG